MLSVESLVSRPVSAEQLERLIGRLRLAVPGRVGVRLRPWRVRCRGRRGMRWWRRVRFPRRWCWSAPHPRVMCRRVCVRPRPRCWRRRERLLTSAARPIVLLERREDSGIADAVAPRQKTLGVMLAYTPLHHLLLRDAGIPLVMTSGNRSDEPIAYQDEEALAQLGLIADAFLTHNRPNSCPVR